MAEDSNNSTEELNNLSQEQYKILRTSKGKEAILHDGFYYNHMRDNKKSKVFKCRHVTNKKECTSTITLKDDKEFAVKEHQHKQMEPIESEIMFTLSEIDRIILALFEVYSSRTNNISETYNHAINGQVMSSKSNVYFNFINCK
jgi:hypothetical protein